MITTRITTLPDVRVIVPQVHEDYRGQYIETYNKRLYETEDIKIDFVQDDMSVSSKGVLRGLHGDRETWKLVSCPFGRIYLVVLCMDVDSEAFGKWESFVISETNHQQVLIPPNYANGHLVLSDKAIFAYKQSTYYSPVNQFTVRWNEPQFGIKWPIGEPILSARDEKVGFRPAAIQAVTETNGVLISNDLNSTGYWSG